MHKQKPTTHMYWKDVGAALKSITAKLPDGIDSVTGPMRGGMLLAILMSHRLGVPVVEERRAGPHTLWIDDIVDSGKTIESRLEKPKAYPRCGAYAALVSNTKLRCWLRTKYDVTLHVGELDPAQHYWWVFPWNKKGAPQRHGNTPSFVHSQPSNDVSNEDLIARVIETIGDDPKRPGLLETPKRVAAAWQELFAGYTGDVKDYFKVFDEGLNSLVCLQNVEFYSHCEHHMVPFYGQAHIAYIPRDGRVLGASKLARILEHYARRLQVQERIGEQVVDALMKKEHGLAPLGAACIITGRHMCMCARGVGKQHSTMVTSALRGVFMDGDGKALDELMQLIHMGGKAHG